MIKIICKILTATVFFQMATTPALALDAIGPRAKVVIIKKNINQIEYVGFRLTVDDGHGRQLGQKKYYSKNELLSQRSIEAWQIAGAALSDIVVIALLAYGAGEAGMALMSEGVLTTHPGLEGVGAIMGLLTGGTGGGFLSHYVRPINPVDQYMDYHSLSDKMINDIDFNLESDEDVYDLALALEGVLNKL